MTDTELERIGADFAAELATFPPLRLMAALGEEFGVVGLAIAIELADEGIWEDVDGWE